MALGMDQQHAEALMAHAKRAAAMARRDLQRRIGAADVVVALRDLLQNERHDAAINPATKQLDHPAPAKSFSSPSPMANDRRCRLASTEDGPRLVR